MCNIPTKVGSFSIGNDRSSKVPNVNRLVEESHERPWIGSRRNRGFQDDIEEVCETDGESGDRMMHRLPLEGRRLLRVDGPLLFVF